ncbi:MAG TPA: YceD family protein [Burkholderiaceae bacterium]|nr:YceD family protein [Burkholderiaceae bacterium]
MPILVDLFRFCEEGRAQDGECLVRDLPRLRAETADPSAPVRWQAAGRVETVAGLYDEQGAPRRRRVLYAAAQVQLSRDCDRCGQPMQVPMDVRSRLEVFDTEGEADEAAMAAADDEFDPIVGSRKFDLLAQVEEELLLELPAGVMHEVCPQPADGTPARQGVASAATPAESGPDAAPAADGRTVRPFAQLDALLKAGATPAGRKGRK